MASIRHHTVLALFLTAIFRACGRPEILSTSHAATLLKNTVGGSTSLEDITLKPVTSDTWFLTGLVDHSDGAGQRTGQPVPSLPRLQANTASPLDDSQSDDDIDDDTLSLDHENGGDNSSVVAEDSLSSKKHCSWSEEDEDLLRKWKEENRPWAWICPQFPERTSGAVKTRWYTKLRHESPKRTV